jgi:hypothetical protein
MLNNIPEYIKNRQIDYTTVENQLDMIYKDMKNGTSEWVDYIADIKTRHPKPVEPYNPED